MKFSNIISDQKWRWLRDFGNVRPTLPSPRAWLWILSVQGTQQPGHLWSPSSVRLQGNSDQVLPSPQEPFHRLEDEAKGRIPRDCGNKRYPGRASQRPLSVAKILFPKMVGTIKSYFSEQIWGWGHNSVGKSTSMGLREHRSPETSRAGGAAWKRWTIPRASWLARLAEGPVRDPASVHTVESDGGTHAPVRTHMWACIQHACAPTQQKQSNLCTGC